MTHQALNALIPNRLSTRLFILASLAALVGIVIVALFIVADYRRNAEARLDELLAANVFNLMGSLQLSNDGSLSGMPELGDPQYRNFDSGWYWQVQRVDTPEVRRSSPSLVDGKIDIPQSVEFDETFQRTFSTTDKNGQDLVGLEAQVFLGEGNDLFSFMVTANKGALEDEIASFRGRLFVTLSIFALSLVLAMSMLVRFGLNPLARATQSLGEIRTGNAKRIEGEFPEEIRPLIDETNALIESNNTIVERARTQVGNLAHSLKTPLAVIQNEASNIPEDRASILKEQTDMMRQQVQLYLDRARISARSSTSIASTPLKPELEKLLRVVAKLNRNMDFDVDLDDVEDVLFQGEAHDLQEICGNLLENAAKYANSSVRVSALYERAKILISIEDDGKGMSASQMELAMKRGGRVDEGKIGWGLGLSIVRDVVEEYSGQFKLARSDLGGLNATVELPASKAK